jgi:hypothetical protein
MKKSNLKIVAITVDAENGAGHKENCTTKDLLEVLKVLDCPVSISITVLKKIVRGTSYGSRLRRTQNK